jgi:formylglycine-generating enzyme required for sulfatase activity
LTKTDHAGKILHGHNGGVWEWTDTEFEAREGYVPSKIYPGYSADFYDGKHFVVVRIILTCSRNASEFGLVAMCG